MEMVEQVSDSFFSVQPKKKKKKTKKKASVSVNWTAYQEKQLNSDLPMDWEVSDSEFLRMVSESLTTDHAEKHLRKVIDQLSDAFNISTSSEHYGQPDPWLAYAFLASRYVGGDTTIWFDDSDLKNAVTDVWIQLLGSGAAGEMSIMASEVPAGPVPPAAQVNVPLVSFYLTDAQAGSSGTSAAAAPDQIGGRLPPTVLPPGRRQEPPVPT